MFKLVFGLIIVGLILYVWYQVRKEAVKFKRQQDAQDELSEIQDSLEAVNVESDVQDAKEKLQKRERKLDKRQNKSSDKE